MLYSFMISLFWEGFKPYYNWNTFNTKVLEKLKEFWKTVLNLIITGIPSIRELREVFKDEDDGFKPYYNWNTFNTNPTAIIDKDGSVMF